MSHIRQQIIAAISTAVTGLATTGARVFRSRLYALQRGELSALVVRMACKAENTGVTESMHNPSMPAPRVFERRCRIEVVGLASAVADLDAAMNQIALEVEAALAMPIVGPWSTLTLINTDVNLQGGAQRPVGEIVLTYEAVYRAREGIADVRQ